MDTFTLIHVLISLAGIVSGFVVVGGMLTGNRLDTWTSVFIGTTVATSSTGFGFPFDHLLPSHIVGVISLVLMAIAIVARYGYRMAGGWRRTYAITAIASLYFNVFVLVVQLFQKLPALKAVAPTQSEPPFAVTQLLVLAAFIYLGIRSVRGFREPTAAVGRALI
jgi:hypothetical protein